MDTKAVVNALKSGKLGALGADVYEGEAVLFFKDLSGEALQDDVAKRMVNVKCHNDEM